MVARQNPWAQWEGLCLPWDRLLGTVHGSLALHHDATRGQDASKVDCHPQLCPSVPGLEYPYIHIENSQSRNCIQFLGGIHLQRARRRNARTTAAVPSCTSTLWEEQASSGIRCVAGTWKHLSICRLMGEYGSLLSSRAGLWQDCLAFPSDHLLVSGMAITVLPTFMCRSERDSSRCLTLWRPPFCVPFGMMVSQVIETLMRLLRQGLAEELGAQKLHLSRSSLV